jgi:hypothetical protein
MQPPDAGLDEKTRRKLDRTAETAARILALMVGFSFLGLGLWGFLYCLLQADVRGSWGVGRLTVLSGVSVYTGYLILRSLKNSSK